MRRSGSGHRALPHTADVRVEAWAATRERCIAEAVLGAVDTFLDTTAAGTAGAAGAHRSLLAAASDEDLLVAVLDEFIYLMDTTGQVPVDVELTPADGGIDVWFGTVDAALLPQVGAVPKAVSLHELHLRAGPDGWSCSVTLDV